MTNVNNVQISKSRFIHPTPNNKLEKKENKEAKKILNEKINTNLNLVISKIIKLSNKLNKYHSEIKLNRKSDFLFLDIYTSRIEINNEEIPHISKTNNTTAVYSKIIKASHEYLDRLNIHIPEGMVQTNEFTNITTTSKDLTTPRFVEVSNSGISYKFSNKNS